MSLNVIAIRANEGLSSGFAFQHSVIMLYLNVYIIQRNKQNVLEVQGYGETHIFYDGQHNFNT